ncbi:Serine protease HTRA1 [Halotydeus destructor]|nr:Serine protease HTRA1 [Halotydeus destructor]
MSKFLSRIRWTSLITRTAAVRPGSLVVFDRSPENSNDYQIKKGSSLIYGALTLVTAIFVNHFWNRRKHVDKNDFCLLPCVKAAIKTEDTVIRPPKVADGQIPPRKVFNFVAEVVEKTAPAVVYIEAQDYHPFFRNQLVSVSGGSGFIVDPNGLIITNAHVVANRASVKVRLSDGQVVPGEVQFMDDKSDLASVKINGSNLPTLRLGSSAQLKPGEFVVALGSPLNLTNTITFGVVSSVTRGAKELGLRNNLDYIQTDAAINIGNSGGPLVDLNCEAIGVNSMKVTEGIAFAIPSDSVKDFLERTKRASSNKSQPFLRSAKKEEVDRPPLPEQRKRKFIGLTMLSLTPALIEQMRSHNPSFPQVATGVLVMKVLPGSPGELAGLKAHDVIIKINGQPVSHVNHVYKQVQELEKLTMDVVRGNEIHQIVVKPEEV